MSKQRPKENSIKKRVWKKIFQTAEKYIKKCDLKGKDVTGTISQARSRKRSPYTAKEWQKIEKLASEKGKTFASPQNAKDYLLSSQPGGGKENKHDQGKGDGPYGGSAVR